MFTCYECGVKKEASCFNNHELSATEYKLPRCKECYTHTSRLFTYKNKYNITQEQYEDLLIDQLGVCAICKKRDKTNKRLSVDHCHTTGKIRELLCLNCNTALGSFQDSEETILRAIEYLRKTS